MTLRPLILAAASLAALSAPAGAGTAPWTADDILALRVVSDPQISPDGRAVVYVVQALSADSSEYQTDLWLAPVGGGAARRLTTAPAADEAPRWSPDGRTIAFLSERPRPGRTAEADDEGRRQIWLIRPDGGEAWPLSDAKGGVSAFEWSHDGRRIGYLAREPKSEERRRREKARDDAWTPSSAWVWNRLWVMDVPSRAATQLTRGDLHVTGFSFSPDGGTLAFAAQPTPTIPDAYRSDLYTIPATGGAPRPLVRRTGRDDGPAWSPDGRWIAFVSQDGRGEDWYTNDVVCVVPAAGGAPRSLSAGLDESVGGLAGGRLVWSPDSRGVYFQAAVRTAQHLYRATLEGHVEAVTRGPSLEAFASVDSSGRRLAFTREASVLPREVWVLDLPGTAPVPLTTTNPQVADKLVFEKLPVTWTGADGREIEGLLLLPPDRTRGARVPLILNVHGGPAGTHAMTYTPSNRVYAWPLFLQRGYAVLMPNPRGSGGYGEKFRALNVRDWGGQDYEDLMRGVDAMIEHGVADPQRLAVCGWSYGGFMTSTIVTKTDRFRAAVVGAGVTDLTSFTLDCDIPEFARSYFQAWPWEDPAFYADHSAVLHAGRVKTPTAVIHGGSDERVPTPQGWEFYQALKRVGVPTDLLVLPRQPHGPREPRLLRAAQNWHLEWFERYVKGGPAGAAH